MRVLLAGASGFLGTALRTHLTDDGHLVTRLVRSETTGDDTYRWDPYRGMLPAQALEGVDVVVNLAGVPIAHWPWTSSYKQKILDSRIATTSTIAKAIAGVDGSIALVNGSGVGYYGQERGDEELVEEMPPGEGFLADVVRQWEGATRPAADAGRRVVLLRTAPVLDQHGGALQVMKRPFQLGVGGRLGDGQQWFPSISLPDWLSAVTRTVTDAQLSGPYNLAAPTPATNAELTKLLGQRLHRPTFMPVPAFALRALLGELSGELLDSLKVRPARLLEAGFTFAHPDLDSELAAALS